MEPTLSGARRRSAAELAVAFRVGRYVSLCREDGNRSRHLETEIIVRGVAPHRIGRLCVPQQRLAEARFCGTSTEPPAPAISDEGFF